MTDDLVRPVVDYYAGRFAEFGPTARGVDWNSEESQRLRFTQLMKVHSSGPFSVADFGCGYGAMAAYLADGYAEFEYVGFDLAATMIADASRAFADDPRVRFVDRLADLPQSDYVVASGVFNVRLDADVDAWCDYVVRTLDDLWERSEVALAFNALTSYSDPVRMREDLWYADPGFVFDVCKRRYSRHVALLHDYGLFEFTTLVRRTEAA